MDKCIGVINSGQNKETYGGLCDTRPDYMLPYSGRYRIIDYSLSTMTNNSIQNVVIYGKAHIRSTLDHIGNGQPWELNRKRNGIFIFPPIYESSIARNEINSYYQTLTFYEESSANNIFIADPMTITSLNLRTPFDKFIEEDLDVLFLYKSQEDKDALLLQSPKITLDKNGRLFNISINLGTQDRFNLFLGKYFIKKELFIKIIKESVEKGDSSTLVEAILKRMDSLKIGLYEVTDHVEVIKDLRTYFSSSMNLLNREIFNKIYSREKMIYTKSKDEPSSLYNPGCRVTNSLVANGCKISGQVENSIIFRGVQIGKNSIIRNSILMQDTVVGENSILVNVISDKFVKIKME